MAINGSMTFVSADEKMRVREQREFMLTNAAYRQGALDRIHAHALQTREAANRERSRQATLAAQNEKLRKQLLAK